MPKHIDNVPKLAEFRPPWTTEDGTEVDIDKDKLKKYIHNLVTDKAKAQDSRDEAVEKVTSVEAERDELKEQVESKDPDQGKKIARLERELEAAKSEAKEAKLNKDRLEVAMEKGLSPKQAARLVGDTKEELEADADEVLELFGGPKKSDDEDEDEDEDDQVRSTPKTKFGLTNGGDPRNGADSEPDYEKIAAQIGNQRVL